MKVIFDILAFFLIQRAIKARERYLKRPLTLLMSKHCTVHTVFFPLNSKSSTWRIKHLYFLVKLLYNFNVLQERDESNNFAHLRKPLRPLKFLSNNNIHPRMIVSTIKLKTNLKIKPTFWDALDLWSLLLFGINYTLVGWDLEMAFFWAWELIKAWFKMP